ncbi:MULTISPECIES: universal stress protein [unclassified Kitasatospora]|uniref:universal stress protein n=1 Tax=unclassified Kitasatospora TaxID=2633591 RepID=UPI0033F5E4D3
MTRQVLVGIDGSPQSQAAADWAAAEAQRSGAPLRLLHAWPWLTGTNAADPATSHPGDLRTAALHALADIADRIRRAHPGLAVETEVIGDADPDGLRSRRSRHTPQACGFGPGSRRRQSALIIIVGSRTG